MKTLLLWILLASSAAALTPTGSVSTEYASKYIFRGAEIGDAAVQPTATLQVGALYGTVWANRPIHRGESNEVDYTLGIGCESGLDLGVTNYTYSDGIKGSWEPFIGFTRDVTGRLSLGAYAFRDFTLHTTTVEARVGFALFTVGKLEGTVDATVGNSRGTDLPSYTYWSGGPTFTYSLGRGFAAAVSAQYTSSTDTALRRDVWAARAGLSFGF